MEITTGFTRNQLPYVRFVSGPVNLAIFEALNFKHEPLAGLELRIKVRYFAPFAESFTVHHLSGEPRLPRAIQSRICPRITPPSWLSHGDDQK